MQVINERNTVRFDSMADYRSYLDREQAWLPNDSGSRDEWFGGCGPREAVAMLTTGDSSRVGDAQKMLDKFDIRIETEGQALDVGVAGFTPSVPDFLGGSPESMFCMGEVADNRSPLKILVDPTSSAGINTAQLAKRGTTILAAVMALAALRPVTLEMVGVLDCDSDRLFKLDDKRTACVSVIRVPVNSSPLDLASACYALAHAAFARRLMYGTVRKLFGAPLSWGRVTGLNMHDTRSKAVIDVTLEILGEDPENTLWIPAISLTDEICDKPVEWVHNVLAKYGHQKPAA